MTERAERLTELWNKTALTLKTRYTFRCTMWLLEEAAWQGARDSFLSFAELDDAIEFKEIVSAFIENQARDINVDISKEEGDFWKDYIGTRNFQIFHSAGDITKETTEVVA